MKSNDVIAPCLLAPRPGAPIAWVTTQRFLEVLRKLVHDHHAHADISIATLHVHLDAESCLEVSLLKGQKAEVEHFASHLIGERGVRYGQLVVVPANLEDAGEKQSIPGAHSHSH
ncbi:nickel-responsive transcriptional regulator NikR [Methylocystis echinoides]|uniref:nickel-responsive transcriptional regulator NikR n=1 Tax=Methylocystis echinoides TaxID=29468 RepID=UPI0024933401|nr:nickel-responsive transcriptional regulator NikR [Methylocystis echinoides]